MANNAQLINWRKVVGNEASLDDAINSDDEKESLNEDDNMETDDQTKKEINIVDKIEPVAGPWANVAKCFL